MWFMLKLNRLFNVLVDKSEHVRASQHISETWNMSNSSLISFCRRKCWDVILVLFVMYMLYRVCTVWISFASAVFYYNITALWQRFSEQLSGVLDTHSHSSLESCVTRGDGEQLNEKGHVHPSHVNVIVGQMCLTLPSSHTHTHTLGFNT